MKIIKLNRGVISIFLFLIISHSYAKAQENTVDSLRSELNNNLSQEERAKVLQALAGRLVQSIPDSALIHAREAFEITQQLGDVEMHSRSFRRVGHASYASGDLDGLKSSLLGYIKYAEETDQPKEIAASYRNLSKIGEATKQPDSSLYYLDKCLEVLAEHPDSVIMIDVFLSKGLSYKYKGFFELSIESLLEGLRISEALDRPYKMGYLNMNLAITYAMMQRMTESAEYSRKAIQHFKQDGNARGVTRTTNNLAIALKDLEIYDEAIVAFEKAIELSEETKMPNIAMHAHSGLASIHLERGAFEKAEYHINEEEIIATEIGHDYAKGSIFRFRSLLETARGNGLNAIAYRNRAEDFINTFREPIEEAEVWYEMSEIHEQTGSYKQALDYFKKGASVDDSLYTIKKEQQFDELNLIYETEKKDAEILLLEKNAELDAIRKRALWGGLVLLMIAAGAIIYTLVQRKRKELALMRKDREIEIEKRKNAEQQLEFKQKELLTKVLQLAKKNQFLHTLEQEVGQLQSSVDQSIQKATGRIARMISIDSLDDEEWDHFGKEFTAVHQDFMDQLKNQYGDFSKNEWRLIALMKMNLSSKDIANILRISGDGVKKARYRLRKKMGLASDLDIQDYIISY